MRKGYWFSTKTPRKKEVFQIEMGEERRLTFRRAFLRSTTRRLVSVSRGHPRVLVTSAYLERISRSSQAISNVTYVDAYISEKDA